LLLPPPPPPPPPPLLLLLLLQFMVSPYGQPASNVFLVTTNGFVEPSMALMDQLDGQVPTTPAGSSRVMLFQQAGDGGSRFLWQRANVLGEMNFANEEKVSSLALLILGACLCSAAMLLPFVAASCMFAGWAALHESRRRGAVGCRVVRVCAPPCMLLYCLACMHAWPDI
jgi:hypothetical protein